jgi:hypothetical protein
MGDSENSLGVIKTRETPSAADAAVALVETLIDGCVDRETLRKKFMERFGGDRNAARTYFSLALRRLANAGEVVIMKSGESEVICRGKELTEVVERWGDLIDALTWRSEHREIDPETRTNGRIITYLVRHGWLKALAAFLCRGAKVWAYIDDPIDLSLVLDALRYVTPPHNISSGANIELECTCPNSEIVVFVPRRTLFTYMATTMTVEDQTTDDVGHIVNTYILKLPGGQTVSLRDIRTDCQHPPGSGYLVVLRPLFLHNSGWALPLIIRFVRVVD